LEPGGRSATPWPETEGTVISSEESASAGGGQRKGRCHPGEGSEEAPHGEADQPCVREDESAGVGVAVSGKAEGGTETVIFRRFTLRASSPAPKWSASTALHRRSGNEGQFGVFSRVPGRSSSPRRAPLPVERDRA
jgi:hypothetical protein